MLAKTDGGRKRHEKAMTMDELCEAEERREATQLSVDDWVARARKFEAEVKRLRVAGWVDLTAAVGYQRRHRKWALKEAKDWHYTATEDQKVKGQYMRALEEATAEVEAQELQAVFDLQQTRMGKATKLWQQATGKHDTLPDLGVLLDWLMGEMKGAEVEVGRLQRAANIAEPQAVQSALDALNQQKRADKAEAANAKLVEALDALYIWVNKTCSETHQLLPDEQLQARAVLRKVNP